MKKRIRRRFRPKPMTTRRKVSLAVVVGIPVLAIFLLGNRGILKRIELESRAGSLRSQLYRERAVGDSLRAAVQNLQKDTTSIERLARERYGMARPGETIYRVTE